jgi:hypothetical protein
MELAKRSSLPIQAIDFSPDRRQRRVRCFSAAVAAAPSGPEPGPPFGQSIAAPVVYLRCAYATGLERLATLMGEVFALTRSAKVGSATCCSRRVSRAGCGGGDPQ